MRLAHREAHRLSASPVRASSPSMHSSMRLSGLQRDVLSLYRKCLREARKKPKVIAKASNPSISLTTQIVRPHFEDFARYVCPCAERRMLTSQGRVQEAALRRQEGLFRRRVSAPKGPATAGHLLFFGNHRRQTMTPVTTVDYRAHYGSRLSTIHEASRSISKYLEAPRATHTRYFDYQSTTR